MDDKFFLSMVDKFNSSNISELEFNDGSVRFVLRKDIVGGITQAPAAKASAAQSADEHSVRLGISSGDGEKINSPIVATFYSSPSPDAPSFVKIGTKIKKGQTLCILKAMKMMNHLEAEFDCEIVAVHASSGELVEYGQELFTVKRN
ncbi:MAG: acetyl-CoA carboxylase biotin carboxyl carrier protein [Treponema sp.]|nr:acetyl-CoA carboxylase biotin carboxyl carrier protein [Treponema sp.]